MSVLSLIELQNDHKHWLQEIERWDGYLRTFAAQQQELSAEFRQFFDRIEAYGRELEDQAAAVKQHQGEIVACERTMAAQHAPQDVVPPELKTRHAQDAERHEQLRRSLERLVELHQAFMTQLALCRDVSRRET